MTAEPAPAPLRLYELVIANGRAISPYAWRTRYVLAHKGLAFESVPLGFTDIPERFGGRFRTVPVLQRGDTFVVDSWEIALWLERAFPQGALFSGEAELAMVRLMDAWFLQEIVRRLFRLYVLDIHEALRPEDRSYFRRTREARVDGVPLEQFTADRAAQLPALRSALQPLREQLSRGPFLGGSQPNYADYIGLAAFLWAGSVATLPPLAGDDRLMREWLGRGFDLFEGIGHDARMRPLFEPEAR